MKRRGFIATVLAALFAPEAAKAPLRGFVIWEPGYVHAPYIPMELEIVSTPIVAQARKLRVSWNGPNWPSLERSPEHPLPPAFDPSKD